MFCLPAVKNVQFALMAIHARSVLNNIALSSGPLSFTCDGKYNGMLSIFTDSVSVMVASKCHSQSCHGYLNALLEAHIMAALFLTKGTFPKFIS